MVYGAALAARTCAGGFGWSGARHPQPTLRNSTKGAGTQPPGHCDLGNNTNWVSHCVFLAACVQDRQSPCVVAAGLPAVYKHEWLP